VELDEVTVNIKLDNKQKKLITLNADLFDSSGQKIVQRQQLSKNLGKYK